MILICDLNSPLEHKAKKNGLAGVEQRDAVNSEHGTWIRVAGPSGQRLILFDYDANVRYCSRDEAKATSSPWPALFTQFEAIFGRNLGASSVGPCAPNKVSRGVRRGPRPTLAPLAASTSGASGVAGSARA